MPPASLTVACRRYWRLGRDRHPLQCSSSPLMCRSLLLLVPHAWQALYLYLSFIVLKTSCTNLLANQLKVSSLVRVQQATRATQATTLRRRRESVDVSAPCSCASLFPVGPSVCSSFEPALCSCALICQYV